MMLILLIIRSSSSDEELENLRTMVKAAGPSNKKKRPVGRPSGDKPPLEDREKKARYWEKYKNRFYFF